MKIQCLGYFTKSNYFLIVSGSSGFGKPQSKQMSCTELTARIKKKTPLNLELFRYPIDKFY